MSSTEVKMLYKLSFIHFIYTHCRHYRVIYRPTGRDSYDYITTASTEYSGHPNRSLLQELHGASQLLRARATDDNGMIEETSLGSISCLQVDGAGDTVKLTTQGV